MRCRKLLAPLLLVIGTALPAASLDDAAPNGVAYIVSPDKGADVTLKDVVSGSVGLLLTRLNAAAQELDSAAAGSPSTEQPLRAAARQNAQLLLLVSYTTTSRSIALTFRVFDVVAARQVGQASQSGRIDLSLDELIAQTFASAMRGITVRPAPGPISPTATATTGTSATTSSTAGTTSSSQTQAGGATAAAGGQTAGTTTTASAQGSTATAATSPGGTASSSQTQAGGATAAAGGQTGGAATTAPPTGDQTAGAANPAGAGSAQTLPGATTAGQGSTASGAAASGPATSARRRVPLVGIISGAAAFLPSGPSDPAFAIGGLATLGVNLRFALGPGTLGAGILSGVAMMQATGDVATGQVLLVPVGVDARYTLNDGGFPGISFHLSGGPAFLNVTAAYAGSLTKLIPYFIGGMTLDLPFASFLGMSIEAAWAAFFESSALTIMGFVPEASLYVRF